MGGGAGIAATAVLSACGIRMQHNAPHIPLNPVPTVHTERRVADQQALLGALRQARRLATDAAHAAGTPAHLPARLSAVHRAQANALARILTSSGIGVPNAPAGHAKPLTAHELAAAEGRADRAGDLAALAGLSAANLPTLAAIAAQRGAAATLLGGAPRWLPPTGPTRDTAATLLGGVRPAVYAFQVIAAQATSTTAPRARHALDTLTRWQSTLTELAGASAPPAQLGYALPYRVDDPRLAARLARNTLTDLLPLTAGLYAQGAGNRAAIAALVQLQAQTVVEAYAWGAPLTAFPGMLA